MKFSSILVLSPIMLVCFACVSPIFLCVNPMSDGGRGVDCVCSFENKLQECQFWPQNLMTIFLKHFYWHLCKFFFYFLSKILICRSSGHDHPPPSLIGLRFKRQPTVYHQSLFPVLWLARNIDTGNRKQLCNRRCWMVSIIDRCIMYDKC